MLNIEHLFQCLGYDEMSRPVILINLLSFAKQSKFEATYFSVMEHIRDMVLKSGCKDYTLINDLHELNTQKILKYRSKMQKIMKYTDKYYPYLMYKTYALYASKSVKVCFETLKKHMLSKETSEKSIIIQKKIDLSTVLPPQILKLLPQHDELGDQVDEDMDDSELLNMISSWNEDEEEEDS